MEGKLVLKVLSEVRYCDISGGMKVAKKGNKISVSDDIAAALLATGKVEIYEEKNEAKQEIKQEKAV